ncbi:MAG: sigma 54-interacting transcriptional regulator [Sandaracinaceae bacterium]|nr:sigma 54-interacting transcriptional regulator [Sandaracinaceae bacterium]
MGHDDETMVTTPLQLRSGVVRGMALTVVDGPNVGSSRRAVGDRLSIGTHPSNDLVLTDPFVSRFHCELVADEERVRVRDVGSSNGTSVDGVAVVEAWLRLGQTLRVGHTQLRFDARDEDESTVETATQTELGGLVGRSRRMRSVMAELSKAARSDATVLLEGETGSGKGAAVEALHAASGRARRPLVVVDCGAIPENLLESELFGHERGAFTGAVSARTGAFEEANAGTLFLDEIGELPLELQPKLLRALENRTIKRVGGSASREVDVRIVAATNRDLRAEVNAGRFRADLFYRLAVIRIVMPSLRERLEDLPLLVDAILGSLRAPPHAVQALRAAPFLERLAHGEWPGNVRQLRNHLERCLVFEAPLEVEPSGPAAGAARGLSVDASVPFADERQRVIDEFERRYVTDLLARHGGRVPEAAQAAGVHRVHLYRVMRKHGIRP